MNEAIALGELANYGEAISGWPATSFRKLKKHRPAASTSSTLKGGREASSDEEQKTIVFDGPLDELPAWAQEAFSELAPLSSLAQNWDGYGAPRIDEKAIFDAAKCLLHIAVTTTAPRPSIVPTLNAGVQLEWNRDGTDIEVEIDPRGAARLLRGRGQFVESSEGPVAAAIEIVRTWLTEAA